MHCSFPVAELKQYLI